MSNSWKMWCRLCADESSSNIDINVFPPQSDFTNALHNFFSINISDTSKWGSMICFNCLETVKRFIEFGNKVSRVQKMFLVILKGNEKLNTNELKAQFQLNDDRGQISIQIQPNDTLYEKQINVSNNNTDQATDSLEIPTTKIEITSDVEDKVDAEDCTYVKLEPDLTESSERPSDYKQSTSQESKDNKTAVTRCPECKDMFRSRSCMRRHLKKQHGLTRTRIVRSKGPFICENCGKICKNHASLDEHKIVHIEDRPFKCRQCDKSFKNKQRLKKHEDTHSTTSYICTICGIQLNSKATLNEHMVVHSDQKRHKCDYCGNEYKRAKALKTHLILHAGLKPYACEFCNRTFANGSNCRSHKKKSHPVELAAMEAGGKVSSCTKVPGLKDLLASLQSTVEIKKDINFG